MTTCTLFFAGLDRKPEIFYFTRVPFKGEFLDLGAQEIVKVQSVRHIAQVYNSDGRHNMSAHLYQQIEIAQIWVTHEQD